MLHGGRTTASVDTEFVSDERVTESRETWLARVPIRSSNSNPASARRRSVSIGTKCGFEDFPHRHDPSIVDPNRVVAVLIDELISIERKVVFLVDFLAMIEMSE